MDIGGTVDIGSWGIDKWVVGSDMSEDMLLVVAGKGLGGKGLGDELLGSEEVNSRWDISESSDTGDKVVGDVNSGILRVDDQSLLEVEGSELISVVMAGCE